MPNELAFVLASCQYPPGLLDRRLAEASYERLADRLDRRAAGVKLKDLLLLGDQVYVDATAGLFDPTALHERYVRPYDRLYGEGSAIMRVVGRLTTYAMLDDHEIQDNWDPADPNSAQALRAGRRFYLQRLRRTGPREAPRGDARHPLWFKFALGGFPFFMADTRTERNGRCAACVAHASIMSNTQFRDLCDWLARPEHEHLPKFIASPALLLPRRLRATQGAASALRSDAWDGFPSSLHALLAHIAENEIENVVFLSGDEHLSCVACASVYSESGKGALIHSVHSSALYAPFPFANSVEADLAAAESFGFRHGGRGYRCAVQTEFADPGDGFAILRVLQDAGRWKLHCEFDRDPWIVPNPQPVVERYLSA